MPHNQHPQRGTYPYSPETVENIYIYRSNLLVMSTPIIVPLREKHEAPAPKCNELNTKNTIIQLPGGGGTHVMHGRSRMTIDPRILMPGQITLGFHRPGTHCLHQARSTVSCWASHIKGELHPAMKRF